MTIQFRRVLKIGNSYGVVLPRVFLSALTLHHRDLVTMRLDGDRIEVKRVDEGQLFSWARKKPAAAPARGKRR